MVIVTMGDICLTNTVSIHDFLTHMSHLRCWNFFLKMDAALFQDCMLFKSIQDHFLLVSPIPTTLRLVAFPDYDRVQANKGKEELWE